MSSSHPHPWHRDSIFGEGPRVPMCRERRAVWRARLFMFRRARKITPLFEDIGLAMLKRLGMDGQLDPAHETVAGDVGCSARSVRRALVVFKAFGLVLWVKRIVRAGWRIAQTSNAYLMTIAAEIPVFPTGGQTVRETRRESISLQQLSMEMTSEAKSEALAGLARVAQAGLARVAAHREAERIHRIHS